MKANLCVLILAAAGLGLSGCQSIHFPGMAAQAGADGAPQASYFVEVETEWFGTRRMTKPHQQGMTVQDALEQSGALNTMRNVDVDVVRMEGPRMIRMPCAYNVPDRHIEYSQDYAIHPNDRILIRPHKTNLLDSAMKSIGATN